MKKEFAAEFNQEVSSYRNGLLYAARTSDWPAFKTRAGKLFDYVENVEYSERERRFFTIFNAILTVLVLAVLAFFSVDVRDHPGMLAFRQIFIVSALAVCGFELYFYMNFRIYNDVRLSLYRRRREDFIRRIEQDFRTFIVPSDRKAA